MHLFKIKNVQRKHQNQLFIKTKDYNNVDIIADKIREKSVEYFLFFQIENLSVKIR